MVSKSDLIWKHKCEIDYTEATENYYVNYKKCYAMYNFLKGYGLPATITLPAMRICTSKIKIIPKEIALMTNLQIFDLTHNDVKFIPTEIGLLTNLRDLCITHNFIEIVPKEMELLTNLRILDLHHNKIKSILCEMQLLTNLTRLSLNHNEITKLPPINSLTKMQRLEIDGTQKDSVPSNLLNVSFTIPD
jgi:Leucine-rich repeat (LRR) protein